MGTNAPSLRATTSPRGESSDEADIIVANGHFRDVAEIPNSIPTAEGEIVYRPLDVKLWHAASRGELKLVQSALEKDANPLAEVRRISHFSPLRIAMYYCKEEVLEEMLNFLTRKGKEIPENLGTSITCDIVRRQLIQRGLRIRPHDALLSLRRAELGSEQYHDKNLIANLKNMIPGEMIARARTTLGYLSGIEVEKIREEMGDVDHFVTAHYVGANAINPFVLEGTPLCVPCKVDKHAVEGVPLLAAKNQGKKKKQNRKLHKKLFCCIFSKAK